MAAEADCPALDRKLSIPFQTMQQVDLYTSEADAAYQGAPGAFSEEAARALLGTGARLMPCATLEQAIEAVNDARAARAVVPVENAISGTVPTVYELLLSQDLAVLSETIINVDHVLVGPPGATPRGIRRVMSHPLALEQCADFFRSNRGIQAVSVFDTAGAVRMTVEAGDPTTAAIASRRAAALYGAEIIAEHIQDHHDNWTRFLLLARAALAPVVHNPQKALLAFDLRHEPGALLQALQPIADAGLSVTKIEGRPIAGTPFRYRFIVELTAPEGQAITPETYDRVRDVTTWFKVLGAFRL